MKLFIKVFFIFAVVASLLSQLPSVLESGMDSYLKLSWIPIFTVLIIYNPKTFFEKPLCPYYIFLFVFFMYCIILQLLTTKEYVGTDFNNMCISCMITTVSYSFYKCNGNGKTLKLLSLFILLAASILAFFVFRDFLFGYDFGSLLYAFASKNSMGSILLSSVVIGVLFIANNKTKITNISLIALSTFILVVMIMMKSRATLAGFFFVILYLVTKFKNNKIRILFSVLTVCCILLVLIDSTIYNIVVNNLLFANRGTELDSLEDLNSISSNRVERFPVLYKAFEDSMFFGIGNKYFDCFPFIIMVQYGIVGAIIVFTFIYKIFRFIQFKLNRTNLLYLITFFLFWIFMINCLFEAQPPFGPGVKCFLLWMMFGFSLAQYKQSGKAVTK